MKIYGMDDTLIEIYNIKNITSIKLWDRIQNPYKSSKTKVVPGLMVTYDGGKMLNICADERYFYDFVKKVTEVYHDEKNNILENSLTDPFGFREYIDIDDRTKEVLENGELQNINEIYKYYNNLYAYNNSLFFQKSNVQLLYPIVKYHIEEFYSKTDKCVILGDMINGYRDRYFVNGKINNLDKTIIFKYIYVNDNKYSFNINGLYNTTNTIKMDIEFKTDRIIVSLSDKLNDIYATFSYITNNGNIKSVIDITKGYLKVYYENKDLESIENKFVNITDMDSITNLKWFKLPWNSMYGINNEINKLNEEESIIKYHTMYVEVGLDSFIKREKYVSSYLRVNTTALNSDEVVLDEVNKNTSCIPIIKNEGIYVIETSFLDVKDGNGYYDGKLKNKYFYHVLYSKDGVNYINKNNIISVNNKEVLTSSDLASKTKILSLVKRDKNGR